jgi:hypothetical protein
LRKYRPLSYDDRVKVANMATFDKFGVMDIDLPDLPDLREWED